MVDEPPFEFLLGRVVRDGQELEAVGIFQGLPGEVGLEGREGLFEVGLGLALAAE